MMMFPILSYLICGQNQRVPWHCLKRFISCSCRRTYWKLGQVLNHKVPMLLEWGSGSWDIDIWMVLPENFELPVLPECSGLLKKLCVLGSSLLLTETTGEDVTWDWLTKMSSSRSKPLHLSSRLKTGPRLSTARRGNHGTRSEETAPSMKELQGLDNLPWQKGENMQRSGLSMSDQAGEQKGGEDVYCHGVGSPGIYCPGKAI